MIDGSKRGRGLDHSMFSFRTLLDQIDLRLPEDTRAALAVTVILQRFHIDEKPPFAVPGMLERPYPDIGSAAQREVGLRSGLARIQALIDEMSLKVTFVVEHDAIDLLSDAYTMLRDNRHDVVAGGLHASRLHSSKMSDSDERQIIRTCRDALEQRLGRPVRGWRSPSCAQSNNTINLLAEEGFRYCGDFNNDDRPYFITTDSVPLVAVPMHHFSSDLHNLLVMKQSTSAYFSSVQRGMEWVVRNEAGPVVLPLVIHPWISGVTHRYQHLRSLFLRAARITEISCFTAQSIAESLHSSAGSSQRI